MTENHTYTVKIPAVSAREAAEDILSEAGRLLAEKECMLLAIDGRCAAGKTTLAGIIREQCSCNVISMDSFFLRPEQRTEERFLEPGGNIDYERFLKEVLIPLNRRESFSYRPYDCRSQSLGKPVAVVPGQVTVIEGSYSLHPLLSGFYDLKVFLTLHQKEQLRRLKYRNESMAPVFREKWIPLEEYYFRECHIREKCSLSYCITG